MAYLKFLLLLLLLMIGSRVYSAEIYMHTEENGNVTYSDRPTGKDAQMIAVTEENNLSTNQSETQQVPQSSTSNVKESTSMPSIEVEDIKKPYTVFSISSPVNEESIQNQPTLTVDIKIDPSLQKGDTIQIYLDNQPWGKLQSNTHFQFTAPDRGTHTISAKLFDEKGRILKQNPNITIYIHQAHVGSPGFQN